MYIAMNRFKIILGKEKEFEKIWKDRNTHLSDVPGFEKFHLAKGDTEETHTLYISHSTWSSKIDFISWGKSKAFQLAHKGTGGHSGVDIGHPVFEGFEIII